ncbi:MAG: UDP-N-acetylglucosamine 2-epimerase (non-hydrolyzing) [Flavobacteriales bacterium]|nr:UDP-N-acetylglucosamine 2-epimerase (non-hydrolyzing) [Flavobacteriales bacterium]|tara:strand:- start:3124 stop:4185 length:1062 start_codon:yes stop_codon:yes gene_type:complete
MKVLTVVGARPQFIKAAAVSRAFQEQEGIEEVIVHTGQHFDANMSDVFFEELKIPLPHYNLAINSLGHGAMTGRMLEGIEEIILKEKPDWVLVYGDTNSTIAGALAAKKLHVKVAHVEAGLRSFNIKMPEEVNRVLTDRISNVVFCPTNEAVSNLANEGFENLPVHIVKNGDVMQDAALFYVNLAKKPTFKLPTDYVLMTMHRAENTDDLDRLKSIIQSINEINQHTAVVWLIHPRTKKIIERENVAVDFKVVDPVGYLEMIYLLKNCSLVMTDSGGLQKEAFFFEKNCVTLRDETEWVELVENDYNILVGANKEAILSAFHEMSHKKNDFSLDLYGKGTASFIIAKTLLNEC